MGMDFAVVLHYSGPRANERAIRSLERSSPRELGEVREVERAHGHSYDPEFVRATWADVRDVLEEVPRPALPSRAAGLRLPEDFFLTFGEDAVVALHILRWRLFLAEPPWQALMLDACAALARHLGSDEFVVTRDESPLVLALLGGAGYHEAIECAIAAGEPDVRDPMDMYIAIDDCGTWDSKGFFRVRLDAT